MQLILVRHGLPVHSAPADGGFDPDLSDEGWRQCATLVRALRDDRIDAVWSSPLRRAVQTAESVAGVRGLTVSTHPGLLELGSDGPYVPLENTEDPAVRAFHERMRHQDADEAIQRFRQVVLAAVTEIAAGAGPEDTVLISCHGGVMSAYASAVLGVADVVFFVAAYTGYSRFTVDGDGRAAMVSLNEHAHLAGVRGGVVSR